MPVTRRRSARRIAGVNLAQRNRPAAVYGTTIVLAHLLVNIVHGAAHRQLSIGLSPAETLFVVTVIVAGPLVAMALLWTSRQRWGSILLLLTMGGALLFGLYHHFVVPGPDHVGEQAAGPWGATFAVTSWLLLLTEAAGAYAGFRFSRIIANSDR